MLTARWILRTEVTSCCGLRSVIMTKRAFGPKRPSTSLATTRHSLSVVFADPATMLEESCSSPKRSEPSLIIGHHFSLTCRLVRSCVYEQPKPKCWVWSVVVDGLRSRTLARCARGMNPPKWCCWDPIWRTETGVDGTAGLIVHCRKYLRFPSFELLTIEAESNAQKQLPYVICLFNPFCLARGSKRASRMWRP